MSLWIPAELLLISCLPNQTEQKIVRGVISPLFYRSLLFPLYRSFYYQHLAMGRELTRMAVIGSIWMSTALERNPPFPSLKLLEGALHTTASEDFDGHEPAYHAVTHWDGRRLRDSPDLQRAPHFACAEYGNGREAIALLEDYLSPGAIRFASHSAETGACFMATASHDQATFISDHPEMFGLLSVGHFPSALKLAPGLLNHHEVGEPSNERLATTHGERMRMENVEGLTVGLSPGTLPMHAPEAFQFISTLMDYLTSKSLDLHAGNVWSDPAMVGAEHHHTEAGVRLARAWTRAADVVHELSEAVDTSPADICSWHTINFLQGGNDILIVSGAVISLIWRQEEILYAPANYFLVEASEFTPYEAFLTSSVMPFKQHITFSLKE